MSCSKNDNWETSTQGNDVWDFVDLPVVSIQLVQNGFSRQKGIRGVIFSDLKQGGLLKVTLT